MLAIPEIIGYVSGFLIGILLINIIILPFIILDLCMMVRYNKREKDAWFPDFIYWIFAITIPIGYYIILGIRGNFVIYEFIMILPYTFFYGGIVLSFIFVPITFLFLALLTNYNIISKETLIKLGLVKQEIIYEKAPGEQ